MQKLLVALMTLSAVHHAAAQGTAFTYEGQLQDNGSLASGTYNFTFSLYNAGNGGAVIAGPVNTYGVVVANGLFQVTLDFGASVWNGATNWLQISVATNGSTTITYLAPLQQITPAPQAIYATTASNLLGTLAVSQLSGTVALAQLPSAVVTENEPGVTLNDLNLSGNLKLPSTAIIFAGSSPVFYADGIYNVFAGLGAGAIPPVGPGNIAIGGNALGSASSDSEAVAIGSGALEHDNAGTLVKVLGEEIYVSGENTAIGYQALQANTVGTSNTAVGYNALNYNLHGSQNTAVGTAALLYNTSGSVNTAAGVLALYNNTTGGNNTAIGGSALEENTSGNNNTAIGWAALSKNSTGTNNTASGVSALQYNTTGGFNTADGVYALQNNTIGDGSTASGFSALQNNTTGSENTADGNNSLQNNTTGSFNTATGGSALGSNTTGSDNTASGFYTLLYNTTGNDNSAFGYSSLIFNTTGSGNTADGVQTLFASTTGSNNTVIGTYGLFSSSTGSYNTSLGYNALQFLTSGSYNIGVGINAGGDFEGNETDNIDIGNAGVTGDNKTIRIGNDQTTTVIAGIYNGTLGSAGLPVEVDASGHLGVRVSSARFKHDIQPMGEVSDVLLKLKPVTFKYNAERDPSGTPEFGLVAEQVNAVDPDLVVRDANQQIYSVRYEAVNAMLLNEFIKEHQTVEDLKARLTKLEQIISDRSAK